MKRLSHDGACAPVHGACSAVIRPSSNSLSRLLQVFEQLFQIYEQRISDEANEEFEDKTWIDPKAHEYDCPGEQLVDVSFKATPNQPSLHLTRMYFEAYAFAAFSFGFLIVSLAIGIFRCAHM
jgi:hypothetical protein